MLTDLKSAKKVTGAKQVTRALKNGTARRGLFRPQDARPPGDRTHRASLPGAGNRDRGRGNHGRPGQCLRHRCGQRGGRRGGLTQTFFDIRRIGFVLGG